ncbi:MAG: oxidoreductase [Candidatus Latescibacteria bacterium]|nr:oxidoreductase [Candidatus Latescibacterota bacterium]
MNVFSIGTHAHFTFFIGIAVVCVLAGCVQDKDSATVPGGRSDGLHRFVVIDPGHFHAALVFKRPAYDGISPVVGIYAPVDEDFTDHMNRVIPFNKRANEPANWQYQIHLGPDYREALFKERFGDIAILSGRNNGKIDFIKACVDSGFNVLADKPWVISPEKYPILETVLSEAGKKGIIAYDIMTERYEITSIVQKLLVNHEPVFGTITTGTAEDPAVVKHSVHHLSKVVAGNQLKRPWWFFDTSIQGEGLVDITTHLVDIVFWILHPEQPIDYKKNIEMVSAKHWPTIMTPAEYETITAKPRFPAQFKLDKDGNYPYYCNGQANFRLDGVNIQVEVIWNYVAPKGTGDTHYSIIKGTKANVLVRQGKEQNFVPELYVEPAQGVDKAALGKALKEFFASQKQFPSLSVVEEKDGWRIDIPQEYRIGHEAHFGQVTDRFLEYLGGAPMPEWENANMLAKYYVTTKALEMAE